MRLTRSGRIVLGLLLLTLAAALASGNNLLYLLYSLMLAALGVSAAALWADMRGLRATARFPEHVFIGNPFPLEVSVLNGGRWPVRMIGLRLGAADAEALIDRIDAGETRSASIETALPHRGRNRLEGLRLRSAFPFGLLERSVPVRHAIGVAFPRPREARSVSDLSADVSESGRLRPRKGAGDELYGIRDYDPSDESRLINWKLTARSGEVLVNEYAEPAGSKVTVRVALTGGGAAAERYIVEAASACKHAIQTGGEVRLITPESEVGYGKGLPHLDRLLRALALLGPGKDPRPVAAAPGGAGRTREPKAGVPERMLGWTYLGGVLVYASLFLIEDISPVFLAAVAPFFALAWRMDRAGSFRLPDAFWTLASLGTLAYILLFDWHYSGITLANTHLLIYLLVNRFLSRKEELRELRQVFLVFFLAFFLVSGQTISLWYFLFFLLYAVFAAGWLMLAESGGRKAALPVAALGGLLVACLGTAGLLFAATPRLEPLRRMNPFIAMGLDKRRPKADFVVQFTENVSLGFFGRLKKSSARVMRIRPLGDAGSAPPEPLLRVRGSAFDRFDGRRWSKTALDFRYRVDERLLFTAAGRAWTPRQGTRLVFPGGSVRGPAMEVTMFPLNSAVLFTTHGLSAIEEPDNAAYFDYTDTAYFGSPYLSGIRYRLYGSRPPAAGSSLKGHGAPAAAISFGDHVFGYKRILRERFLQVPDGDPRLGGLAERLTREAATPGDKIAAVLSHLRDGYAYSTYSDDAGRTLGDFLFGVRSGNCEYFATAAAVLLRAAGVPTRLVTGFLVDEWNEYGKFYDVRQGQAHAWVEAYVDGTGWVTVDATPPSDTFSARTGAALARLGRYFTALQFKWYRHIIGYDRFVQRNTFYRFRLSLSGPAVERWMRRLLKTAGAALLLVGLGSAVLAGLRRLRRPPAGRFQRALALLHRAGLRRRFWETPREFADAVARSRPELAPLRALSELHYIERYSTRGLLDAQSAEADRLLEEMRTALRRKPSTPGSRGQGPEGRKPSTPGSR
ncbi:MAG: transglutaminaseTgpA domain-containing protein [Elusimicrobiota bacterium]